MSAVRLGLVAVALAGLDACSGGGGPASGAAGGASGGVSPSGGAVDSSGGSVSSSGGALAGFASGAGSGADGGASSSGGRASSGGTEASGGVATSGGAEGTGGSLVTDPGALIVSPSGKSDGNGTLEEPMTLSAAISAAAPGKVIYLRAGIYALATTQKLTQDGLADSPIALRSYPSDAERPKLDFSAMAESSSSRGLELSGDYWHIYGIDVFAAGDNGMFVSGSHNVIENSTFSECADSGLQLGGGASDNLVLNCDSYFNADSSLENADGFAAKLDVGTLNKFLGCRAWNNLDDGWDGYLRPSDDVTTTYENCWAIDNGKLKDGSVGAGDGNGFKTGGSDDKNLRHNAVYRSCIAAGNVSDGFDHNSNRGSVTILNSAAHDNGSNINFSSSNIAASLAIKNTISLGENGSLSATSTDIANNSWQDGRSATDADFVSVDIDLLKSPRKADGSLPEIDYLKLVPGSDLINAGVDVGLAYQGSAPEIGPFEVVE